MIRSGQRGGFAAIAALLAASGCGGDDSGDDDTGDADGAIDASVLSELDPAPEFNEPGEYGCDGCPTSDFSTEDIAAGSETSFVFTGAIDGAAGDGIWFVTGGGRGIAGTIPNDPDVGTAFTFTVPLFCGEQLVKCVWSNEAGRYVLVTRVITTDCVEPDIRVTLDWDAIGFDWELHLIKPGGTINDDLTDCTWSSCMGQSPDWGLQGDPNDDPLKDVDNTGAFGPENIFLLGPEDGTYTVMVEHWASGDPSSDGRVVFNVAGAITIAEISDLAPQHVWTAGTIDWPSGEVSTTTDILDCTANWASGCHDDIP